MNIEPNNFSSTLPFDPDEYRHHIEEFQLTEAQQDELLKTLWEIMSTMVNIGWGVDNVQLMLPEIFNHSCADAGDTLETDKHTKDT